MQTAATILLYRSVNQTEPDPIEQSGWKRFPLRLPEHPIFYPVMNEAYTISEEKLVEVLVNYNPAIKKQ